MEEAKRLASSPAGRELFALLRQSHGAELEEAMAQAAAGDYDRAQKGLAQLLESPQVQALVQALGGGK